VNESLPSFERGFSGIRIANGTSFDTTEVRWFASGTLLPSFVEWFTNGGRTGILEIRYDVYRAGHSPDIGLKQRDHGPLEAKLRRGINGSLHLDDGVHGRIEEWQKVRVPDLADGEDAGHEWIEVHKVVVTRTFEVGVGGVIEVEHRGLDVPGCDVEIASIEAAGTVAWTFGLEAWGSDDVRRAVLEGALAEFVARSKRFPPDFLSSLGPDIGYPEWLAGVIGRSRVA
jgi:hypothetical protein